MIGIKLEGDTEYLDTLDDTEIEIQLENPLLGDAERLSPGSLSIPFNLPGGDASPKNSKKLKDPDVIENWESYTVNKATLFYDDVPYKNGTIKARTITAKSIIQTNFFFGLNSISSEFKTAKLRDVLNDIITVDTADYLRAIYVKYVPGTGDRTITVNGTSYTGADWATIATAINANATASLDSGKYVPRAQSFTSGTTPGGYAQPFIKIWLSIYNTLPSLGFVDSVDPLQELSVTVADEELVDFIFDSWDMAAYYASFSAFVNIYSTLPYATDKFRVPTCFNANLHNGELLKSSEIINAYDTGGMVRNYASAARAANSLQPFAMLKYVLDTIADAFGFTLEGDFYEDADTANRLLDNSVTLDVPQEFIYNRKFIFWRRSFNMNELVPDITVVDFLKRICGRYNVGMYYSEETKKVNMTFREPLAKSYEYEDLDAIASPIESNEDLRTTGFTLRVPKEDTDALSVEESVTIGTPESNFELGCGRLFETSSAISGGFTTGPRVSRKNNDKFGLRVFYYNGIVNNGTNDYPQADISGGALALEQLADVGVDEGIYTRYHKYWLLFEKNRLLLNLKVNWPLRQLMHFDWTLKRRYDRTLFFVKGFKVKLTNKGVKVSDVQLYTMK